MNILQKRIENLCDEIIGRILALMQANSVSEVVLTDNDNPVYVIWFDKIADSCECSVHKVAAVGEGIILEVHDKITKENYYYCPIKILQSHKIRADFICEVSPFSLDFSRQTIKSNHGQKYTF